MSEAPIRPTVLKTQIKIDFLCSVFFFFLKKERKKDQHEHIRQQVASNGSRWLQDGLFILPLGDRHRESAWLCFHRCSFCLRGGP